MDEHMGKCLALLEAVVQRWPSVQVAEPGEFRRGGTESELLKIGIEAYVCVSCLSKQKWREIQFFAWQN